MMIDLSQDLDYINLDYIDLKEIQIQKYKYDVNRCELMMIDLSQDF